MISIILYFDFDNCLSPAIQIKSNDSANALDKGILSEEQFVLGSEANDSRDRFIYDQSTGNLFFDLDGNGKNEQTLIATLNNQTSLVANDLHIV